MKIKKLLEEINLYSRLLDEECKEKLIIIEKCLKNKVECNNCGRCSLSKSYQSKLEQCYKELELIIKYNQDSKKKIN